MKKTLSLILCAIMLVMMALPVSAVSTAKNAGTANGTTEKLTLDGKMDAAYVDGLEVAAAEIKGGKAESTAVFYTTYTSDALWIFCEIRDKTLDTKLADPAKPTFQMDSIEIMLDPDNKGENTADKLPLQMRIDFDGNLSARKGQKGTSLYHSPAKNGNVDFYEAKAVKVDGGFDAEYKIPLSGLKAGKQLGFNFCYNDWDTTGKNRTTLVTTAGVDSWTADKYNYFVLGDIIEPVKEAAPAANAKAPATADLATLAVIAVVSSLAGAVTVKSRRK